MSYHPAKFDGHRCLGRGDTMISICCVIFQGHVITLWARAHHGKLQSVKFGGHRHPGSEDMF